MQRGNRTPEQAIFLSSEMQSGRSAHLPSGRALHWPIIGSHWPTPRPLANQREASACISGRWPIRARYLPHPWGAGQLRSACLAIACGFCPAPHQVFEGRQHPLVDAGGSPMCVLPLAPVYLAELGVGCSLWSTCHPHRYLDQVGLVPSCRCANAGSASPAATEGRQVPSASQSKARRHLSVGPGGERARS